MSAEIGQPAILPDGFGLKTRNQIGERVIAGIIVELILPRKTSQGKYGIRIDHMRPSWRNVEGSDLRSLIRRSYHFAVGPEPTVVSHQPGPCVRVCASNELGVWNQDRVNWKFRLRVS